MKKLILILYPFKFRNFDYNRFEIQHLIKQNNVIIFELINIFYPNFRKAYKIEKKVYGNVIYINSFYKLLGTLKDYKKNYSKIFVLNFIKNDSFKGLYLNNFVNSNFQVMTFFNPGVSTYQNSILKRKINIVMKTLIFFSRWKETVQKVKGKFISFLVKYFQKSEKYCFVSGRRPFRQIQNIANLKNIKIIKGNSWDYSKIFFNKKKKIKRLKNYGVYLDAPGPKYLSDSYLHKVRHTETISHTYPSLRSFFKYLEKISKKEVIIAPHPKTKIRNKSSLFGYRKVISNKTQELIKNADYVLTRNSTAITFALVYKKPIILIYTDEIFLKESYWNSLDISKNLKVPLININKFKNFKIYKPNKKILKHYLNYLNNFCTFQNLNKPNNEIINNLVSKIYE